jgi:flagellar protein FliS
MTSRIAKAYGNTAVETAVLSSSSKELIILVYEKINDYLTRGKKELELNQPGVEVFTKAVDLINLGLIASLDKAKGGEIANNLEFIYLWSINKVVEARLTKSPEKIDEVIKVLKPLQEGWVALKDVN